MKKTKMNKNHNRINQLIGETSDSYLLCTLDYEVIEANKAIWNEYENEETPVGKKCYEIFHGKKDVCKLCPVLDNHDFDGGPPVISFNKEKNIFQEERIFPLRSLSGEMTQILISCRNETQTRELDFDLGHVEKLAKIGQLSSGVAHDFNNVLTGILGQVRSLKNTIKEAKVLENLDSIEKAAMSGVATVFRIKNFSRSIESDSFKPVDLNRLLEEVVAFSRPKWKEMSETGSSQIKLKLDLSGTMVVMGNEAELRNSFINILFNAVEAIPDGGIIRIKSHKRQGLASITIEDSGIGMNTETLKNIFTPFFTTKNKKGTGLGMAESNSIINNHNGSIHIDSKPDVGTTVLIKIPLSHSKIPSIPVVFEKNTNRYRILVFDDQDYVLEVTKDLLEEMGHEVFAWTEVKKGLEFLKNNPIDMVLTDYGMEEMNGHLVSVEVKKMNKSIPVILMSGWAVDIESDPSMKEVIDYSMPKPFTLDNMREAISFVMSKND